jgi:hypothetical protein
VVTRMNPLRWIQGAPPLEDVLKTMRERVTKFNVERIKPQVSPSRPDRQTKSRVMSRLVLALGLFRPIVACSVVDRAIEGVIAAARASFPEPEIEIVTIQSLTNFYEDFACSAMNSRKLIPGASSVASRPATSFRRLSRAGTASRIFTTI